MSNHESLSIRGAAEALHVSERTVRRYLQAGKLQAHQEPMAAGGWRWAITVASVDALAQSMDTSRGRHAGADSVQAEALERMAAEIERLTAQVAAQTAEIAELREIIGRLLPAAQAAESAEPRGLLAAIRGWRLRRLDTRG